MLKIIISKNKQFEKEYYIENEKTYIGRLPSVDIPLFDNKISRKHAKITFKNNKYTISDLDSRNGFSINSKKAKRKTLKNKDKIKIGPFILKIEISDDIDNEIEPSSEIKNLRDSLNESYIESEFELNESKIDNKIFKKLKKEAKTFESNYKKLSLINEITKKINSTLNLQDLFKIIMDMIIKALNANSGIIILCKNNKLTPAITRKNGQKMSSKEIKEISSTIAKEVIKTKKPIITVDAFNDSRFLNSKSVSEHRLCSIACLPLIFKNNILGAIYLNSNDQNTFKDNDKDFLMTFANQASSAIAMAKLHKEMIEKQELKNDMLIAKELQENLIPKKTPDSPGIFNISAKSIMAKNVGGDYYDFFKTKKNKKTGIVIADASGKGISAAMLVAMTRGVIKSNAKIHSSPALIATNSNDILITDFTKGKFVTAIILIYDPETGKIKFSKCGHEDPILIRDKNIISIESTGLPLGIYDDGQYWDKEFQLKTNDKLILFTDGVTEAKNNKKEFYGHEKFKKILRSNHALSGYELIDAIFKDVNKFRNGFPLNDDTTVVILEINTIS